MSMFKPFTWLAALLAVMGLAATASAQRYQPFIDPGYFEPDFQFFAPAEVSDFGGGEDPNTGLYFDYDRIYAFLNRPDDPAAFGSQTDMDGGWGNRYEAGYMTEEDTGWQFVATHFSGPNVYHVNAEDITFYLSATGELDALEVVGRDSLNVASLSAFELNKVWRRKEFHNGSILEPVVGFRYMNFKDFFRRDVFDELGINIPPVTLVRFWETDLAQFENTMFGGQVGGRWFWQRGHWLLSTEVKFFAAANFQQLSLMHESIRLPDDPDPALLIDIAGADVERTRSYARRESDVWGGEVRAEASYELTREINLRFGFWFLDIGHGLGRGNRIQENNQDAQYAGVSFGLTVNR